VPITKPTAKTLPGRPRAALSRALTRDQGRLRRLLSHWEQAPDDGAARAAFEQALAASIATREARATSIPQPRFDESLPVSREAERIVELIRKHQVIVIAGETGSGKTTQLPKLCLAAGRGAAGLVGCTQPRRIAARSVARRVAQELGGEVGGLVGYQVRFTDQVSERSLVKFMTDGILLAEIQSDRMLSAYDTIIVDEAHERSLNIDFLLGYLKRLLKQRRDLKLIVTSATIDTERFARHFEDAPVLSVEGRSYPVEVRYFEARKDENRGQSTFSTPADESEARGAKRYSDPGFEIVAACDEISREDPLGDVLIFLPGEREIRDMHRALEKRSYKATEVLPLYARLSVRDQDRIFNPGSKRRIVLATNVAETSLTVPRIRYVVDPGVARIKRYSARAKLDRLHIEPISQASADQRMGRCGRVASGVCYRLYPESDYLSRPRYTDPEILRASLAGVILRMLSLGLGRIEDFPFLEAPDARAIADGWQQLAELGAVDKERRLSPIGRQMARLPVDPKLSRMLVAAEQHGVLAQMLPIAAFLAINDPRERPADARQAADQAHAAFADPKSEFAGIVRLWEAYRTAHEDLTQSRLRDWCERHFLSFLRMREWRELHRQLLLMCEENRGQSAFSQKSGEKGGQSTFSEKSGDAQDAGHKRYSDPGFPYALLHRALIAGLPGQIGHRLEKGLFEGPRGRRYALFPGSALASKPPPWVLSALLLDTHKVWALVNAVIEPDWVIAELPHLLARKHFDPHWSRSQGRVVGAEQISLFGLVLAPRRPIHYGSLYPQEARDLFVRQGMVVGEVNTRCAFLERNLRTLEQARQEEAKLRRAGLVADEDWQARWYLDRLPEDMNTAVGLDAWYRRLSPEQRRALEWSLTDLLPGEGSEADRFPKFFALGDARLALTYRFEPGAADDGVSLSLPLHLLNAIDGARLSWLVPGLVEEKATALIRSLPKALRRSVVPAPDFARAFAEAWPQPSADALTGELARFLRRASGAELAASDFDDSGLPVHLRMNIRLVDSGEPVREPAQGSASSGAGTRVLAESRELDALRARFGLKAEQAFAARAARGLAKAGLTAFPEHPVPLSVPGEAGLPAFPALVDEGGSVALQVFAEASAAALAHPQAVRRLLRIGLEERVRQARKQLPVSPKAGLLYASIESAERLRSDIVEAALSALLEEGVDSASPETNDPLLTVRDRASFEQRREDCGRRLFGEAMRRLELAEAILQAVAALRPRLESNLMGWARANLDDLRAHLDSLVYPGFLRQTPPEALAQFPRYLKALALRAERAKLDPVRDQARMLELAPFVVAVEQARLRGEAEKAGWQQLRWELEELRVQTFAQELGTRMPVSPKRLAKRLQALGA